MGNFVRKGLKSEMKSSEKIVIDIARGIQNLFFLDEKSNDLSRSSGRRAGVSDFTD